MNAWKRFWAAFGGPESPKQITPPEESIDKAHRETYTPVDVAIDRLGRVGHTTEEIINLFHMETEAAGHPHAVLGIMDTDEEEGLLKAYENGQN